MTTSRRARKQEIVYNLCLHHLVLRTSFFVFLRGDCDENRRFVLYHTCVLANSGRISS
jgi:hypothetical protein